MKLRALGFLVLVLFCFGVVSAYAEESKNQLYFVYDVVTSPSTALAYETNLKKMVEE